MVSRRRDVIAPSLLKVGAPFRGNCSRIGLAVAAALAISPPRVMAAAMPSDAPSGALDEVIVTARKRSENLQDVPESVNVLTEKDLKNLGITGLDDYAEKMPSISFISLGPGTQLFVMRGVSDGSNPNYANTSATGVFLDDVSLSLSGVQPDLHLYDIAADRGAERPAGHDFRRQLPWRERSVTSPTSRTYIRSAPASTSTAARSRTDRATTPMRRSSTRP